MNMNHYQLNTGQEIFSFSWVVQIVVCPFVTNVSGKNARFLQKAALVNLKFADFVLQD